MRNLRRLEWYARSGHAWRPGMKEPHADGRVACLACRCPFVGRLFDPEVQLPIAGWTRAGTGWVCRRCGPGGLGATPPRIASECGECGEAATGATSEERVAAGWRELGDQWVCSRCAAKLDAEGD